MSFEVKNETNDDECSDVTDTGSNTCADAECSVELDLPGQNKIDITCQYNDDWIDGMVSAADLTVIQAHRLGTDPFFCMIQFVAADATGDGEITSDDQDEIQDILLGNLTEATATVPAWTFTPTPFYDQDHIDYMQQYEPDDTDYEDMWDTYTPGAYNTATQLSGHQVLTSQTGSASYGYCGIKMGDVNFTKEADGACNEPPDPFGPPAAFSWDYPTQGNGSGPLTQQSYHAEDREPGLSIVSERGYIVVYLQDMKEYKALQLDLKLPATVSSVEFAGSDLPGFSSRNINYIQDQSSLRLVWFDRELVQDARKNESLLLRFRVVGTIAVEQVQVHVDSRLASLAFDYDDNAYYVHLRPWDSKEISLSVFQIGPSPFADYLYLRSNQSFDSPVTISLYSLNGYKLYEETVELSDFAEVNIGLPSLGLTDQVVIYQVTTSGYTESGRLMYLNER
ncbi:MAG: dockerin type I repeat-containing protein [Saprospiraceae bacterium]|nr:dockerin type I repeat-containing protein [Saprospiraceae bacterium]